MNGFIQAKNYRIANRTQLRLIVIHTMENPEKPGTAHSVASWFGSPMAPIASAHLCIDDKEVWGCVHEKDVAFAAPGSNSDGFHIEHAGRAAQTPEQWTDEYSMAMLRLSAKAAADVAHRHDIPAIWLSSADLVAGHRGFCGHRDISRTYHKSTHTDPGPNFPFTVYLEMVREGLDALAEDATPLPPAA